MGDNVSFEGKAVLVTGAGGGLGRAYALEMARRGAAVVVNDPGTATNGTGTSEQAAETVAAEIRDLGGQAVTSHSFVGTPEAADEMVGLALEHFGRLDAVITNAGILTDGAFEDVTPEEYQRLIDTHVGGAYWTAQRAYRAMLEGGRGGRIVVISSNSGIFGSVIQSAYAAAKTAMLGLVRAVSLEGEEHGILINGVLPVAMTRLAGVRQTPTPELAEAVGSIRDRLVIENVMPLGVYLASERCTTTGQLFSAVGGRYARVVVGVTDGWLGGESPATVEALASHWDEVCDAETVVEPRSGHQEMVWVAEKIAAARSVA